MRKYLKRTTLIKRKQTAKNKEKIEEKNILEGVECQKKNKNNSYYNQSFNANDNYNINEVKLEIKTSQLGTKEHNEDKKIDINSEKEINYDEEIKKEINNNSNIRNKNIQKNSEEKNNSLKQEIIHNETNKNSVISLHKEQKTGKKVMKKDNTFPKGTKYEEELNSNFKYF